MTSRERLQATLRRETPDRVPVNTYELSVVGWPNGESSYERLMAAVAEQSDSLAMWGGGGAGLSPEVPTDSQTWTEGEFSVTRATVHTPRGDLTRTTKAQPTVMTTWTTEHLCKTVEDIERYLSLPLAPVVDDPQGFREMDQQVGERGLVMGGACDPIGWVAGLFEFGQFTVFALTEPKLIRALCDHFQEANLAGIEAGLQGAVAPLYRICGAEYLTPPFLPPRCFAEFEVPYLTEIIDLLHRYGTVARVHCHGRVGQVLEMIVECGADALDPLEPPPDGDITLGEIKRRYGDRLILLGGMELKYLETETPERIDQRVRELMEQGQAGGGYVLMPTAAPIDIPLSPRTEANYLAFLEAGEKYGRYE